MLEKYLEDENSVTADDLKRAIRNATINHGLVPVLTGSAFKNKGVQPLLDAVVDYLPSPLDLPPTRGMDPKGKEELERKPDVDEPFAALAFKIVADPHGKLTYFRVYSGQLEKGGAGLQLPHRQEGAGRPHPPDARQQPRGPRRRPRRRHRGRHRPQGHPHRRHALRRQGTRSCSRPLEFPEPVIHVAVEPKTKQDQDKMGKALSSLSEEDPTFTVRTDEETGQTIIAGMGELHLEVLVDRMLREFSVEANVGKPQVAYRETLTGVVEKHRYTHKKQTGGSGQFADVVITLEPTGPGGGYEFVDKITGGRIPKEYIPAVDHGVQAALTSGVLADYPMVDVRVTLARRLATTTSTPRRWRSAPPASWASRKRPARPSRCSSSRSWPSRS